jgi:hypothetical protein
MARLYDDASVGEAMKPEHEIAALLVVAFKQHHSMLWLAINAGIELPDGERVGHGIAWLPENTFAFTGHGKGRPPVRAYVARQWPNLSNWLIDHVATMDAEGLRKIAQQIMRLKYKDGKPAGGLTADERKDIKATKKDAYRVRMANKVARSIQESTQRGAWNVVKR